MNTSPVSGENAATTRERGAADRHRRRPPRASPVIAAQFATPSAAGVAMRSAVRLTVVGSTTATRTPAHVAHASARRRPRHRQAVLAERVTERGTERAGAAGPT